MLSHSVRSLCVVLGMAGLAAPAVAQQREYPGLETGKMWTFDAPPLQYWATRYHFAPSTQWLDHVRMSTLRQPGCTASFVSADGLVMTNHHCARACIDAVTKTGEDFLENGFYARTREEERACPSYWLDQLQQITDVTDSVNAAVPARTAATRAADLRAAAIRGMEQACRASGPALNCQVVTMYRGGQYKLYKFHRYTDVRLVFAVESQTAFFGGDPDNFTFPRYDVDMSFYRAYANGQPAHPEHFTWSRNGSAENDLVFVVGNPGSTGRLNTVAQLDFLRDVQYPAQLDAVARQIAVYHSFTGERAKAVRNTLFGAENSQKAIKGYQSGLLDPQLIAQKKAWEKEFRRRVTADASLRQRFGAAWDSTAAIRRRFAAIDVKRRYYAFGAYGTRLLNVAAAIVRVGPESAKPDSARRAAYRTAARPALEALLYDTTTVDTVAERSMLTAYFTALARELPATDPVRKQVLQGKTPEAAAAMVAASSILTADQRRALVQGGALGVAASKDPFITLARLIDPLERAMFKEVTDLTNREAQNDERVARALLAVFGNSVSPDATFSLRISDGEVKRFPYNGTVAQPYTTIAGLYDRSAGFGGQEPFNLARRWRDHRDSLNLWTPLNAASTNDIIGGNSGSPVINTNGEVVGLIFDGNIESLPWRFLFTEAVGRSVWVDSRAIIEAFRHVYDAGPLADELTSGR
jgi:hypothetical protein